MGSDLVEVLHELLSEIPGQTVPELRDALNRHVRWQYENRDVREALESASWFEARDDGSAGWPKWHVSSRAGGDANQRGVSGGQPTSSNPKSLELRPWQDRALKEWQAAGRRGVIEAVTGAGKTHVALCAMREHLGRGISVCVLIPTIELQVQWEREIRNTLGVTKGIGKLGGGHRQSLGDRKTQLLLATPQSGMKHELLPQGREGLLVADEVHHLGADQWSLALEERFEYRLGLTATYERDDNGIADFLDPYFGGVVYRLGYEEALADKVISRFRIAFIGVDFEPDERAEYDKQDEWARKNRRSLVEDYGLPREPFGEFMKAVTILAQSGDRGSKKAGLYLSAFSKRRQILARSRAKLSGVAELEEAIRAAERSILFAQTKEAAEAAVDRLHEVGIDGRVLTSDMDLDERHQVFAGFEDGDHDLVAAPRLLDEGVDVPAADLAIVLASSRSRRQMVQRMGRVVRLKADGRPARLAVLYVQGTAEDPHIGAHQDFLHEVMKVADNCQVFRPGADLQRVICYLAPDHVVTDRPVAKRD